MVLGGKSATGANGAGRHGIPLVTEFPPSSVRWAAYVFSVSLNFFTYKMGMKLPTGLFFGFRNNCACSVGEMVVVTCSQ